MNSITVDIKSGGVHGNSMGVGRTAFVPAAVLDSCAAQRQRGQYVGVCSRTLRVVLAAL